MTAHCHGRLEVNGTLVLTLAPEDKLPRSAKSVSVCCLLHVHIYLTFLLN